MAHWRGLSHSRGVRAPAILPRGGVSSWLRPGAYPLLKDVDRALPRPALRRCHVAVRPGPQPSATPPAAGTSACLADRTTAGQYPPLFRARPRRSATAAHRPRVDWLLETALRQCRLWRDQDVRKGVA